MRRGRAKFSRCTATGNGKGAVESFEKQEIFVNFIEKNYEKKDKFYYSKSFQKEVNLILKNSKSARDSVLKRWNNEDTNEDTNVIRTLYKASNTNNNVNSSSFSSVSSVKNLLKAKENSTKNNFNIFWENYIPIETLDGKVTSKGSQKTASKSYLKAIAKHTPEVISDGLERYLKHCQANSILTCGATVFLNQERYLNDETVCIKAANRSPPKKTANETYNSIMNQFEDEK